MSEHGTDSPGNEAGIDPAWADIDTLDERLRIALTWVPGVRRDAALRTLDALTERAKQAVDREVSVRYCLNVHGDMLCNGPQGHEGGCVFEPGWMLARRIEDDCVSIAAYAGDTTNELRETRDEVERLTERAKQAEKDRDGAVEALMRCCKCASDAREALAGKETTT